MEDMDGKDPEQNTDGEASVDPLSVLPVEVIYQIMEHLTLREAAKMSVLSSNWRKIWLSLPSIEFDLHFVDSLRFRRVERGSPSVLYSTMNRIFQLHEGPIVKFSIAVPFPHMDINPWLSYILKSVRELEVGAVNGRERGSLKLSSYPLFSCSELRILKLYCCTISIPPTFTGFSNLVTLELREVIFSGDVFGSLIHTASLLEELVLDDCEGFEDIVLDCPLLKMLEISGTCKSICFKNAPNLTVVDLSGVHVEDLDYEKALNLINFLASSCTIETLVLGAPISKLFLKRDTREKLLTFDHLKRLGLGGINLKNGNGFSYVTSMMRSCPNMRHFLFDLDQGSGEGGIFEIRHNFTLDHLRQVEISGFEGVRAELKLIEFLLMNSPKLVKLEITKHRDCKPEWEIPKELMTFPRASSEAGIIMLQICDVPISENTWLVDCSVVVSSF